MNSRSVVNMERVVDLSKWVTFAPLALPKWSTNFIAHSIRNLANSLRSLYTSDRSSTANSLSRFLSERRLAYLRYSRNRRFKRSFCLFGPLAYEPACRRWRGGVSGAEREVKNHGGAVSITFVF